MLTKTAQAQLQPAGDITESAEKVTDSDLLKIEELTAELGESVGGGRNAYHYSPLQ